MDTAFEPCPAPSDSPAGELKADIDLAPALRAAGLVVSELLRAGVDTAVVCPGSRNSPLLYALAEASRQGLLRVHVRTDERTAAFLALGLARYRRQPVPVVMTSGTAVANCLPAMVEATLSHVPLLVVSADRPAELIGSGANQTIEQRDIFGVHSVHTTSLDPDATAGATAADIAATVAAATHPITGGGAHINVPFTPPLHPATLADLQESGTVVAACAATRRPTGPTPRPHGSVAVDVSLRTLVIAGDVTDSAWARDTLDTLADLPTLAEPTAPAPDFPVHPAAAALFQAGLISQGEYSAQTKPEQIIVIGRPTLHRSVAELLLNSEIPKIVLTETTTTPHTSRHNIRVGSTVTITGEQPAGWGDVCHAMSDLGAQAVRDALSESQGGDAPAMSGLHAAAVVADSLRDGDAFVVGASNVIRDISLAGLPFDGVTTIANRGAAGIDGTLSTAIGIAHRHGASDPTLLRAPRTVAVMGDLTFLHDLTALNIGPLEARPDNLLVIVVNDHGGGIFETLEPGAPELREFGSGEPVFERYFGTALDCDLSALCEGFGVDYHRATTVTELAQLIDDHAEAGASGITVIEAAVSRAGRRELDAAIKKAVTPR